jgi:hypothetical protein
MASQSQRNKDYSLESWRGRALLRRVQIALKPASKTFGLHRILIRSKGLEYAIADSAFELMQVDARAC